MGWYGTPGATRQDIIDDVLADWADGVVVLDKHMGKDGPFVLIEADIEGRRRKLIVFFLIERHGGTWGYKPMDEAMGPDDFDCPLRLLDAADEPLNDMARDWRAKVEAYHKNRQEVRGSSHWIG